MLIKNKIKQILYGRASLVSEPKPQQIQDIQKLSQQINKDLIFDTKRAGKFCIAKFDFKTASSTVLIEDTDHLIYPDVSNKTNALVYAKAKTLDRNSYAEIWLKNLDQNPIRIAKDGTFPTFSSDGQRIFFERSRRKLMCVSLNPDSSVQSEEVVFDGDSTNFGGFAVVKPRVSPDGKHVLFTSDKAGRWNLWCANLEDQTAWHVAKGCEGCWYPDSNTTAWIKKYGWLDFVGIYGSKITEVEKVNCIQDDHGILGHEYFPFVSADAKFLIYSACPIFEHDHTCSRYDLFCKNLQTNQVTRLTFDGLSNRWAKY